MMQLIGSVMVFAGAAFQLFDFDFPISKYIFSFGALSLIIVYFVQNYQAKDEDKRIQRQYRLMLFAALFLGVSAFLMFKGDERWVVLVLLYALISVFLSFRGKKETPNN